MKIYSKDKREIKAHEAILSELQLCKDDPVYFINKYAVCNNYGKPIKLWPHQEAFIRELHTHKTLIALKPRQSGLTLATEWYIVWKIIFEQDKSIVSLTMASNYGHCTNNVAWKLGNLPQWMKPVIQRHDRTVISFTNGMLVKFVDYNAATRGLQGLTINFLHLSELGWQDKQVQEDVWMTVIPSLSRLGNSAVIESSANGRDNLFAEMWHNALAGNHTFTPFRVYVEDLPHYSDTWKAHALAICSQKGYSQDYDCEFI